MICVVIASLETGRGRVERVQGVIVVGGSSSCNVVLQGRGVSGTHCRLSPMPELPGAYLLEDLASTYGTFVNNARVGRPVVVSGRDVVSVGDAMFMLAQPGQERAAIDHLSALATPQAPAPAAPAPVSPSGFDAGAPWMQQFEHFDGLARAWQDAGRPNAKLLRGPTVRIAEQWLAAGAGQSPSPGALHRDFVEQSRNRRLFRIQLLVLALVLGVLAIGGGIAAFLYRDALVELWAPPDTLAGPIDEPGERTTAAQQVVDLSALIERAAAEPDSTRRLLLEVSVAEVARTQGKTLQSDEVWGLQRSAHASLAEQRETILRGHAAAVGDVELSPDGSRVASGSEDGSARLWDFSAPAPGLGTALRGHIGPVGVVAFSPDGTRLATGGEGGKVFVWRVDAPEPGTTGVALVHHEHAVRGLAWQPDGRRLVSGDDAGKLVVWSMDDPSAPQSSRVAHEGPITALLFEDGEVPSLWSGADDRRARQWGVREDGTLARVRTLDEHIGGVSALAVSANQRWAATGTTNGEVVLWPRWTRKRKKRRKKKSKGPVTLPPVMLEGHRETIASLAFTPDGEWLVSAGGGGLRMWDLRAKDPSVTSIVLPGHSGDVTQMTLAAGNRAVTGGTDNTLRVWDLEKSQKVIDSAVLDGHTDSVRAVAVSGDGLRIVSGSADGSVRVWDAFGRSPGRGGAVLRVGPGAVQDAAVADSGLVFGVSNEQAKLWDLRDRSRWRTARALQGAEGLLSAGALDRQGERAAVGTESGAIFVWSVARPEAAPQRLDGHAGSVNALAFLPDGRLMSVSSDRSVRLWTLSNPDATQVWAGHNDEAHVLIVSPRGDVAFSGGLDGTLLRWNLADGTAAPLVGHEGEILQLRLSPDASMLASASADRRARLWDVATGKSTYVLRGHEEAVQAVAFGRSQKLATGGGDAQIRVWDLTSEHPDESPQVLRGHEQSVRGLVFTRDTNVLASASNDQTVRLWRLDTGRELVLPGHDGVVAGAWTTADGSQLISAGFDGTVRVWPLTHDSFARTICDVVGATLAEGEAAQLLGVPVPDPCVTGRR